MTNFSRYLTITDADKRWGFYITTVGCNNILPNEAYPQNNQHPPSHAFNWNNGRILDAYYLVFISKGEGTFESSATDPVRITAGTCFFLFPGVWHRYKPDQDSGWEEYWVGFKGTSPDSLIANGFFSPNSPFIHFTRNDKFLQLFQQLITTVKVSDTNYQPIISGIALQLLGLYSVVANGNVLATNPELTIVEKARFLMQENIETVISMEAITAELNIGYSYFRKLFRHIAGVAPNQYYLDLRLKKAIELMTTTNLNFKEIAHKTGFESSFYFSKIFKRKYGVGPKVFKARSVDK